MPDRSTRVIVRVVKSPVERRGDVIVVLPESRSVNTRDVLAYRLYEHTWVLLIDTLRHLMDCTRAADPHTAAAAKDAFEYFYGEPVVLATKANPHVADEPPADED